MNKKWGESGKVTENEQKVSRMSEYRWVKMRKIEENERKWGERRIEWGQI